MREYAQRGFLVVELCDVGARTIVRAIGLKGPAASLRLCVERTFAWEDKFKRLLLRFEFKQQRHYGMKLMAYTLINLRHFCGA
jgi:hypothetical protein